MKGTCRRCKGHRTIIETPCTECEGKGSVIEKRNVTVPVPAGKCYL